MDKPVSFGHALLIFVFLMLFAIGFHLINQHITDSTAEIKAVCTEAKP